MHDSPGSKRANPVPAGKAMAKNKTKLMYVMTVESVPGMLKYDLDTLSLNNTEQSECRSGRSLCATLQLRELTW